MIQQLEGRVHIRFTGLQQSNILGESNRALQGPRSILSSSYGVHELLTYLDFESPIAPACSLQSKFRLALLEIRISAARCRLIR